MGTIASAAAVAAWLDGLGYTIIRTARLKIGKATYTAAQYTGKGLTESVWYVLGGLPASYRHSTHVAYRFEHDSREWYVAGHYSPAVDPKRDSDRQFHPFGQWFSLRAWPTDAGAIDKYARRPYQRQHITVLPVSD